MNYDDRMEEEKKAKERKNEEKRKKEEQRRQKRQDDYIRARIKFIKKEIHIERRTEYKLKFLKRNETLQKTLIGKKMY